jgi:hypothetical protein
VHFERADLRLALLGWAIPAKVEGAAGRKLRSGRAPVRMAVGVDTESHASTKNKIADLHRDGLW